MTTVHDRPAPNGHPAETDIMPNKTLPEQPANDPEHAGRAGEHSAVRHLRTRLADRTTERDLAHQFTAVDEDEVFDQVRSEPEQRADRAVAETLRSKRRKEKLRAGKATVRAERRARLQATWMNRAERARDRILDPARALATDHRRWLASSLALFALIAAGVAFMSDTVKTGVFGANGNWLGYLIEPLASVMLVISMLAQFTARQRDLPVPRGAVAFDLGLALASLLLNTVPWGLRFGFDPATLLVHLLVPMLVIAAVIAWHTASGIYGDALAASRANSATDEALADRLALLRAAVRSGELPVDVSAQQVIKYLRQNLPGGIGQAAARKAASRFLGY